LTYLGFVTEGKLAAVLITPSLGVPNWPVIYIINTTPPTSFLAPLPRTEEEEEDPTSTTRRQNINKFSGAVAGEKEDFYKGSFAHTFLYFVYCFVLLASFYKKYKKISSLYSCYFITFSSLCCSLSTFWRTFQ
jgi:hypothetical protein